MNEHERFAVRCRMTCLGGSERGTCPCEGALQCEEQQHPRFQHWRKRAVERMARLAIAGLGKVRP